MDQFLSQAGGKPDQSQLTWEQQRQIELEEKRQKLSQAMADTLKEDREGTYSQFIKGGQSQHMDENGLISKGMIDDIREAKYEQLLELEEKLRQSRLPYEDLFGIKRRTCTVCEEGCPGYEPNALVVSIPGEFPTFCKSCKCPAHFHTVCITPDDILIPEELKETFQNHNIASKDINFNCVMLAFQLREESTQTQNMSELLTILKEEGLEVISVERRELEVEEAIYLKGRMIGQSENLVLNSIGLGVHRANTTGQGRQNEIRRDGKYGSAHIGKSGSVDPYLINRTATQREQHVLSTVTRFASAHPKDQLEHLPGVKVLDPKTSSNVKVEILDTINQRVPLNTQNNDAKSVVRSDLPQKESGEGHMIEQEIMTLRRETIVHRPRDTQFKVKTMARAKTAGQKKISLDGRYAFTEAIEETLLIQAVTNDALIQELITKEAILIAVGSATFQNLEQKLRTQVLPKLQIFLPVDEMPLLYLSDTRTCSLEDCIHFFPGLFKLTKSIVVAEPVSTLTIPGFDGGAMDVTQDLGYFKSLGDRGGLDRSNSNISGEQQAEGDIERKPYNMKSQVSQKLKGLIKKREQLKAKRVTTTNNLTFGGEAAQWIERAREKGGRKKMKLLSQHNKILYNYGVLHDFFNYSAMCIQDSVNDVDLARPTGAIEEAVYELQADAIPGAKRQTSNIFAIAKVGVPNLILPSSLELKLSNYNAYSSYLHLCDSFFPSLSKSEHSVLILRPLMVKNGLNDYLVQILRINEFIILKRRIRKLTRSELVYLAEKEGISDDKCETYYNLMMDSEVEIIAVSKMGATKDLKTLVDGCAPFGRRRIAQLDEDTSVVRTNVDAVNSMFEITPFTSMSEMIDIEDYIVSHTKLEKYKKLSKKGTGGSNRLNQQLYYTKLEGIRKELNLFSRYFNVVGHAAGKSRDAQEEMCILMPEVAIVEEVILLLNPIYAMYKEPAEKLLVRMGYKILAHKQITIDEETSNALQRESSVSRDDSMNSAGSNVSEKLSKYLQGAVVEVWHLTKLSGDREVRQLFSLAQVELEDILTMKVRQVPFKQAHFAYLFLFMDTQYKFEIMFNLIWGPELSGVTGQDIVDGLSYADKQQAIQLALSSTLGDKIKELAYDRFGNILNESQLTSPTISVHSRAPQIFQIYGNPSGSTAVHTLVESEQHGLFEIRFTRLPHKGDCYNLGVDPSKLSIEKLKLRYFTKFEALNLYYNEVNKYYYNVCPAFYRFKVCPLVPQGEPGADMLNRVYEVEEYMGKPFIDEISNMHQEHIRMLVDESVSKGTNLGKSVMQIVKDAEQKSLPHFMWGSKLATMVKNLQKIRGNSLLQGAGRLIFEKQELRGEVRDAKDYYRWDRARFNGMLSDFKKGWGHFMSQMECDLIETKLRRVLDSQTFKASRQPGNLALIPDKINEINLRISEKVQLLIEGTLDETSNQKFYKHLSKRTLDAENEEQAPNLVKSIMHTLYLENARVNAQDRRFRTNNEGKGFTDEQVEEAAKSKEYSTYKDFAVIGVEVARRPKHQLLASIWYLINFWLRKIDRKTDMFKPFDRQYADDQDLQYRKDSEAYYDQVLDILVNSLCESYGQDEINQALDVVNLDAKTEDTSEFDRMVRERKDLEDRLKQSIRQRAEDELRAQRSRMTFDQLLQTIDNSDPREEEIKQAEALKKFVETKGYGDQHGEGFLAVLKQTQSYLGPYSLKMAHDYLRKVETSKKQQEKISFVKMEYFLYAVSQAHETICDLRRMDNRYNELQDQFDLALFDQNKLGITDMAAQTGYFKSALEESQYKQKSEKVNSLRQTQERLRYQISTKESELVLIFRELMSWDFSVPDYYFDENLMLDRKMQEQLKETYLLPTRTFWRPVYFDSFKEPDIMNPTFALKMRDHSDVPPEVVKLLINPNDPDGKAWKPFQGVLISYLRPFDAKDKADYLKFDKFYSLEDQKEHNKVDELKGKITKKLAFERFEGAATRFGNPYM